MPRDRTQASRWARASTFRELLDIAKIYHTGECIEWIHCEQPPIDQRVSAALLGLIDEQIFPILFRPSRASENIHEFPFLVIVGIEPIGPFLCDALRSDKGCEARAARVEPFQILEVPSDDNGLALTEWEIASGASKHRSGWRNCEVFPFNESLCHRIFRSHCTLKQESAWIMATVSRNQPSDAAFIEHVKRTVKSIRRQASCQSQRDTTRFLNKLPNEVWLHILQYLHPFTLIELYTVNKDMADLAKKACQEGFAWLLRQDAQFRKGEAFASVLRRNPGLICRALQNDTRFDEQERAELFVAETIVENLGDFKYTGSIRLPMVLAAALRVRLEGQWAMRDVDRIQDLLENQLVKQLHSLDCILEDSFKAALEQAEAFTPHEIHTPGLEVTAHKNATFATRLRPMLKAAIIARLREDAAAVEIISRKLLAGVHQRVSTVPVPRPYMPMHMYSRFDLDLELETLESSTASNNPRQIVAMILQEATRLLSGNGCVGSCAGAELAQAAYELDRRLSRWRSDDVNRYEQLQLEVIRSAIQSRDSTREGLLLNAYRMHEFLHEDGSSIIPLLVDQVREVFGEPGRSVSQDSVDFFAQIIEPMVRATFKRIEDAIYGREPRSKIISDTRVLAVFISHRETKRLRSFMRDIGSSERLWSTALTAWEETRGVLDRSAASAPLTDAFLLLGAAVDLAQISGRNFQKSDYDLLLADFKTSGPDADDFREAVKYRGAEESNKRKKLNDQGVSGKRRRNLND